MFSPTGFMLLAGRVRKAEEEQTILEVLQKHFKRVVDPNKLFSAQSPFLQEGLKQVISQLTHVTGLPGIMTMVLTVYSRAGYMSCELRLKRDLVILKIK